MLNVPDEGHGAALAVEVVEPAEDHVQDREQGDQPAGVVPDQFLGLAEWADAY